jgi:hypothetical protein
MGIHGEIKCPKCSFSSGGRLGMGEEHRWGQYVADAQQELAEECPDHSNTRPWKFTQREEWQ